jgi:integrase/recombinase XerD
VLPQELTICLPTSQQTEMPSKFAGLISLANSVKRLRAAPEAPVDSAGCALYTRDRGRKYVNQSERGRFLVVAETLPLLHGLLALLLAWTGARISEALSLTPASFQIDECKVTFVTLKRRKFVTREVPISKKLMQRLDRFFSLRQAQRDPVLASTRLWRFSRVFAWQVIKGVMKRADIHGPQACPKGLRHGAAIAMLHEKVSLNKIKIYLGHARISTTEIYLDVSGPEERELLAGFWRNAPTTERALLALLWIGWMLAAKKTWSRITGVLLFSHATSCGALPRKGLGTR